jgi:hypothetical protein
LEADFKDQLAAEYRFDDDHLGRGRQAGRGRGRQV